MQTEDAAGVAAPLSADDLDVAAGADHEKLQGWVPDLKDDATLREALDKAFDYRGNVTLKLKDGSVIEGYAFDRRSAATLEGSVVRIIPINGSGKINVSYADIQRLEFTGKDTAAGKSFESWIAKYWAKKAAGETNIHIAPEELD